MSAIDFVVRGDAGVVERGSLAGASGSNSVIVGAGQDISLNLQRGNILSYVQQGQALQVTLVDGTVLTLQGFFTPEGAQVADLFISANGSLAKADLVAGEGNLLYAQYVDADSFGKWSPDDDLYFVRGSEVVVAGVEPADDSAGMLGVPLLGALGGLSTAGLGAAALGGGLLLAGSGGGDGETPVDPTDENPTDELPDEGDGGDDVAPLPVVDIVEGTKTAGHTVNEEDYADGIDISGTGTPNATGVITVGDVTQDITVDGDGNWTATFEPGELPDGEYEQEVSITITTDGGSTTSTDVLVVDTVATVTFAADIVETNGEINFAEESDGFALTGTTQAGSSVVVTFDGNDYVATVDGDGNWSLNVDAGVIAQGEYDLNVSVKATDEHGNMATTDGVVRVDTITSVTVATDVVAEDGTVNAAEHAQGVTVDGLAEAGATVVVTAGSGSTAVTQTVTASSTGTWTATFASGDIAEGTYDLPITAVSTDLAGNSATASGIVQVDTENAVTVNTDIEGDGIVNKVERADGITLTGTTQANSSVEVDFNGTVRFVDADGNGAWSADFPAGSVPQGETTAPVSVKSTDPVGNVATTTGTVVIDTVNDVTVGSANGGDDGVINMFENGADLGLSGVTNPNASVVVTFQGQSETVTADGSGAWSTSFAASSIPSGETSAAVSVVSTDTAGNVATNSTTIDIDTFVNRLAFAAGDIEGDDVINRAEASDGVTLNGVVEAGSTVFVTFDGVREEATVDSDGNWTVNFAAGDIRDGTYTADIKVDATDAAGNILSIEDTVQVDTVAPDAPEIEGFFRSNAGVEHTQVEMGETTDDVSFHQFVDGGASASEVSVQTAVPIDGDSTLHIFDSADTVPDGSHLVVSAEDDAGNTNSTLFVLEENANNSVDMTSGALEGFDIGTIDLHLASNTSLTLSTAELQGLSDNNNELTILGRTGDSVELEGTVVSTSTTTIGTETYNVHTLDDDTTLTIDQDITFSTI